MMSSTAVSWSVARIIVAGTGAVIAAVVAVQPAAGLLRLATDDAPLAAAPITLFAALAAALGCALLPRRGAPWLAGIAGVAGAGAVSRLEPGAGLPALAIVAVAALAVLGARRLGALLPVGVDSVVARRPVAATVWAFVALLSATQTARLAAHLSDRDLSFVLATTHPFWHRHECLPAYLHGAELALRGEPDVYASSLYPGLDPSASPDTALAGMTVEDPFQYPPQFLLAPAAALALTHDVALIRVGWFATQFFLFVAAFVSLARWVGGTAGRVALWLLPAALAALPVLYNFQYGQAHLATISLSVLALLSFDSRRFARGGLMLAVAILTKLFPAVLLVGLAARRRWRALGWTAAAGAALTVLTLAVFGAAPFAAFFGEHLPRLGSGAAFAFDEAWPELAPLVVADNHGIFGLVRKLGAGKPAAALLGKLFALALAAATAWIALRLSAASRWQRAVAWLALLGLGSMSSAGAWADYVRVTAVWLLALVAAAATVERRLIAPLAVTALLQVTLAGTVPIGEWFEPALMTPVATVGQLTMAGLFIGAIVAATRARRGVAGVRAGVEAPPDAGRRAA
jgi:hypothetical protein